MTDEIIERPFNWNDNLSEIAQEDFSMIRQSLSYGTATSIGMALAKLELLEKQGCKVEPQESEKTETWNGIHAQITAPKGTFEKIFNDADDDDDDI